MRLNEWVVNVHIYEGVCVCMCASVCVCVYVSACVCLCMSLWHVWVHTSKWFGLFVCFWYSLHRYEICKYLGNAHIYKQTDFQYNCCFSIEWHILETNDPYSNNEKISHTHPSHHPYTHAGMWRGLKWKSLLGDGLGRGACPSPKVAGFRGLHPTPVPPLKKSPLASPSLFFSLFFCFFFLGELNKHIYVYPRRSHIPAHV